MACDHWFSPLYVSPMHLYASARFGFSCCACKPASNLSFCLSFLVLICTALGATHLSKRCKRLLCVPQIALHDA
jgi:hypothetical protein